jgi:hypothetical protein
MSISIGSFLTILSVGTTIFGVGDTILNYRLNKRFEISSVFRRNAENYREFHPQNGNGTCTSPSGKENAIIKVDYLSQSAQAIQSIQTCLASQS